MLLKQVNNNLPDLCNEESEVTKGKECQICINLEVIKAESNTGSTWESLKVSSLNSYESRASISNNFRMTDRKAYVILVY